jgi:4-cresol dehydrogenase (hydroxylating) flavoprotein subunit
VNIVIPGAFARWEQAIGGSNVRRTPEQLAPYRAGTTPASIRILGALLPGNLEQVVDVVRIAAAHRIPLYPISTGRNWGYGDARPVRDGCVLVDLSRMNRIQAVDDELGVVTLEPGVTQSDLYRYLEDRSLPFLVPTTGAGPGCSIIGNALERGYGITPLADHFQGVTWIEAVLPDGQIYRTPLTEMGAERADKAFKWGVGPYLDGLFAQGSFGIVTRAAIALARQPETVEAFYFRLDSDEQVELYTRCVRDLLNRLGSLVGGVNLMNAHRVLSTLAPYPVDSATGVLSDAQIDAVRKQHDVPPWLGLGTLYGPNALVKAARNVVRTCLAPVDRSVRFVNRRKVTRSQRLLRILPARLAAEGIRMMRRADAHLDIVEGRPSELALPLAYWRSQVPRPAADLNPARDGCGLLWYAPLVPMNGETVRRTVDMVRRVCTDHAIEPLITLTSLSDRCFDMTVPILFPQHDEERTAEAYRCFRQLFRNGCEIGVAPYRMGVEAMTLIMEPSPYWRTVSAIKQAIDPHQIMAPGRYSNCALPERAAQPAHKAGIGDRTGGRDE